MRYISLCWSIIFIFYSCNIDRPSEKVRIASKVRSEAAKKIQNELGLIPCGFGGGMMHKIRNLHLAFFYYEPLDLKNSRKMLIQAANIFLNEINSNEKIRPYLCEYPFLPKDISLLIVLQKSDGSKVDKGDLTLVSISDGIVEFKLLESEYSLHVLHEESYEEAIEKLQLLESKK